MLSFIFRSRLVLSKRIVGSRKYFFHARLSIAGLDAEVADSIRLIAWMKICRTELNILSGMKEIEGAAPQRVPIDSEGTSRIFVSAESPVTKFLENGFLWTIPLNSSAGGSIIRRKVTGEIESRGEERVGRERRLSLVSIGEVESPRLK